MRKHHKKWNVVQSGHCTVVLLHLASHRQVLYRDTRIVSSDHRREPRCNTSVRHNFLEQLLSSRGLTALLYRLKNSASFFF